MHKQITLQSFVKAHRASAQATGKDDRTLLKAYEEGPCDWNRWGGADDIGRANLLDPDRVLAAANEITNGRRFSLALPLASPQGDPRFPGTKPVEHIVEQDARSYSAGGSEPRPGGLRHVDDWLGLPCHGTTHMDALGHTYVEDSLWNGASASEAAVDGLSRASVGALAAKGVVGRAVLVDVAGAKSRTRLDMHEEISLADVEEALSAQRTEIRPGDTLILRTGSFSLFYEEGEEAFYRDFEEPGLAYDPSLVSFLAENDVVALGSDTMANEQPYSADLGAAFPLHIFLQRNLGIIFLESLWLEDWAADCREDGRFSAFLVAAPLRLVRGSAAPMNPVVIK